MNVATLEAALPAATNAALTLITADGQVAAADAPQRPQRTDVHAVWTLVEELPIPDAGGLGRTMHGLRYTATVHARSATQAQRRALAEEFRAYFHHKRKPAITGLDHAEVLGFTVQPAEGMGPAVQGGVGPVTAVADVLFVGDVELS